LSIAILMVPNLVSPEVDDDTRDEIARVLDGPLSPVQKSLVLPGIAGEIQDYYLRTAPQPSEILSVPTALSVVGTLICERILGPSGPDGLVLNMLHVGLGPSTAGKNRCLRTAEKCLVKADRKNYLGPERFKSGGGVLRWIETERVSLCLQDEFGAMLLKLAV